MGADGSLDRGRFGNKYPAEHLSPCGGDPLTWKVTMSLWFSSPWEAVRFSLEAQRLIALQFFPFAHRTEQTHQEEASGAKKAVLPGLGFSSDLPIPPRSREAVQATTAPARNATNVRKATGPRKKKNSTRKGKNTKQRG
jgi:hypothetical protein